MGGGSSIIDLMLNPSGATNKNQLTFDKIKSNVKGQLSIIQSKSKGFTLIELLVVIAIIGILASFAIASFTSAQAKGRDSRRKADLDAVSKALALVQNDCTGGNYPVISNGPGGTSADRYVNFRNYLSSLNYMKNPPQDPMFIDTTGTYKYEYSYDFTGSAATNVCSDTSGGTTTSGRLKYWLRAVLENSSDPEITNSAARCSWVPTIANNYIVCSP